MIWNLDWDEKFKMAPRRGNVDGAKERGWIELYRATQRIVSWIQNGGKMFEIKYN